MLRSRGFSTGAAVSSFLLRPASGVAQGFAFFDAELPDERCTMARPALERDGQPDARRRRALAATQNGQRFFLFVQVDQRRCRRGRDAAGRSLLKERRLYDKRHDRARRRSRGRAASGLTLDDARCAFR